VADPAPAALAASPAERHVSTNLWAYRHWLRRCRGMTLTDRDAIRDWATREPAAFRASIHAFARLPDSPTRLPRHAGIREALVCRTTAGPRRAWSRDALLHDTPADLPPELGRLLRPACAPDRLTGAMAMLLLDADLRPDDRVLVAGTGAWPWVCALLEGATLILDETEAGDLARAAMEERATLLVAPSAWLARSPAPRLCRTVEADQPPWMA